LEIHVESIKKEDHFFEPDPRSQGLGPPLTTQYEMVSYFQLHDDVPESVRSYMNMVVTLWLYGWLYYPFYPLAVFHSTTAVELALQERFPEKRGRGLKKLLQTAKDAGVLTDAGFPSLHKRRDAERALVGADPVPTPEPEPPYVDVLIWALPNIRNRFAHPEIHTIMPPGTSVDFLILAAEIINQLWPVPLQR
jgi:hypothetical protein